MIKTELSLNSVKDFILSAKSKPALITLNLGRNKFVSFNGKINGVYPALFTVAPDDKSFNGKTSYSYSELMCGRVKVTLKTIQ